MRPVDLKKKTDIGADYNLVADNSNRFNDIDGNGNDVNNKFYKKNVYVCLLQFFSNICRRRGAF